MSAVVIEAQAGRGRTAGRLRSPRGRRARPVIDGIGLPQALRWNAGALWFSDQFDDRVYRWDGAAALEVVAEVARPGGLGFLPDGRLLVASTADGCLYRLGDEGGLQLHADLTSYIRGPLNDLITDRHGRAWVGNYGFDFDAATRDTPHSHLYAPPGPPRTALVRVDPDGRVHETHPQLMFPNGSGWPAEPDTLLVCQTLAFTITAISVDADGTLGAPQEWAKLIDPWLWRAVTSAGLVGAVTRRVAALLDRPRIARHSSSPIAPEALAPMSDGSVWVANALRGEAVRLVRGGQRVDRVRTSGHTLGVVRGGEGQHTLYAATVPTLDPELAAAHFAGRIEAIDLQS